MFDINQTDPLWLGPYAIDPDEEIDNLFRDLDVPAPGTVSGESLTVYDIEAGAPVHIADFDPATDRIYLQIFDPTLAGAGAGKAPKIALLHDAVRDRTQVWVGGMVLATINGDPGLASDDIIVTTVD